MTTDLVVIVPGIMGSSLVDEAGREVWGTTPGGLLRALATLGSRIRELELPPDHGDEPAPDGVVARVLVPSLHAIPGLWTPIRGYSELVTFARRLVGDDNLVLFPYDWRLSNRMSAARLAACVDEALTRRREREPDARVIFVCHSMGGLVARWYLDRLGGAEVARLLITLGTPHRGALDAVTRLVNGVRPGFTDFARSLPSAYQILPEYACIEGTQLRKVTETRLPVLDEARVADAMAFHDALNAVPEVPYPVVPLVGIRQPTFGTARVAGERVEPVRMAEDLAGDGTVPSFSARPKRMRSGDPALRGVGEGHGALAGHRVVLDQLLTFLSQQKEYRDVPPERPLGVLLPELHAVGEDVVVGIETPEPRVFEAVAIDERGREVASELVRFRGGVGTARLGALAPGGYTVAVREFDDPAALPVRATTLVW